MNIRHTRRHFRHKILEKGVNFICSFTLFSMYIYRYITISYHVHISHFLNLRDHAIFHAKRFLTENFLSHNQIRWHFYLLKGSVEYFNQKLQFNF